MKLLIVESPTKARTIQGFVGDKYKVLSSMGHIIDLPRKELGVDVAHNFAPTFEILNKKTASELKKASKDSELILLATDPDREGEAIAYHLKSLFEKSKKPVKRVLFYEITKKAVQEALEHPTELDNAKVEAQQTRRILDRLVGYEVSPLLWNIFRNRDLSAGRVQSVALRLICEREEEIRKFEPKEYWVIKCQFADSQANLIIATLKDTEIPNEAEAKKVETGLQNASFTVKEFKSKIKEKKPFPPYITSTLQQDASARLGFSTKSTMRVAQQLFEGIKLKKEGMTGLITYMRTDSLRIADHAIFSAREFIEKKLGKEYVPSQFRVYAKKNAGAHEAIRPTNAGRTPDEIKDDLTEEQFKIYSLIWQRFLASQCANATYEARTIDIDGAGSPESGYKLRAESETLKFPGFTAFYKVSDKIEKQLPELKKGEKLDLKEVMKEQKFTQPKPRFTEGTMVRELESNGIGRPSTYANIISRIIDKRYVNKLKGQLVPTELGESINKILIARFKDVFNVEFTSKMEAELDKIELKKRKRLETLNSFYEPFEKDVKKFDADKRDIKLALTETTNEKCEICGSPMVIKWGRYGKFLACSAFPACKNIKSIINTIGIKCPECGKDIVEKRTRKGKIFYGCSGYPKCKFASWDRPVSEKCPECGYPIMIEKRRQLVCPKCNEKRKATKSKIPAKNVQAKKSQDK